MKKIKIGSHNAYIDPEQSRLLKEYASDYTKDYRHRMSESGDLLDVRDAKIGGKIPFKKWDPSHPERYSRPITIFDTETGHNDEILSLAAIKVVYNNFTRQLEFVDQYERYYHSKDTHSKSYREHLAVHGLTPKIIEKLRKQQARQQGLKYNEYYSPQEEINFREFFRGSILSGHNIAKADIPWALGDDVHESVIDTLDALVNMRGRGGNKLDQAFRDITGMSMEQAGFSHHNALSDVFATGVVLNALMNMRNDTGSSIRYVLRHKGTSLAPTDTVDQWAPSQVISGHFKNYLRDTGYYISRRNVLMDDKVDITDPETGKFKEGYGYDQPNIDDAEDVAQEAVLRALESNRDLARTQSPDALSAQFMSLVKDVKATQQVLSQSLRDLSGSLNVHAYSARPAQVRFLSKFASTEGWKENQAWLDAAQSLSIPSKLYPSYYKTSRDLYLQNHPEFDPEPMRWNRFAEELKDWDWEEGLAHWNPNLEHHIRQTGHFTDFGWELSDPYNKQKALKEGVYERSRYEGYDYNQNTQERLRIANQAEYMYKHGKITKSQYNDVISTYDNMGDALDEAVTKTEAWTSAIRKFSQIPLFNPDRLFSAYESGVNHVLGASRGVIPSPLLGILNRGADMVFQNNRYHYAPFKAADNIIKSTGLTAAGIGAGIGTLIAPGAGTLIGGAIGGLVQGTAGLTTQIIGNVQEAKINRHYQQMSIGMQAYGIGIDLILMPFKLLHKATTSLTKSFLSLSGTLSGQINAMASLGNPLTTLTGVNYTKYQGLEIAEGMLGLGKGTLNRTIEDYAKQRELLYTTGQYDQKKAVAASMLGVFDEVYGPTGTYEGMISKLAQKNLTTSQMALVTQLDPHSAQILEIMKSIGATSLADLENPTKLRDMYFNPLDSRKVWDARSGQYVSERTAFRMDAYEFGAFRGSVGNSFMRIADTVWRAGGKQVADTISRVLDTAATGNWKGAWDMLKGEASGPWDAITTSLKDAWDSHLLPGLINAFKSFVDLWLSAVDQAIDSFSPLVSDFMNTLMNIKLSIGKDGITFGMKGKKWRFEDFYTGYGMHKKMGKEDALSELDHMEKLGINTVIDVSSGQKIPLATARKMVERGWKEYEDYAPQVQKSGHAATDIARQVVDTIDSDTIKTAITEVIDKIKPEVKTTLRLIIDGVGSVPHVQEFIGGNGSTKARGVGVTVSTQSGYFTNP